MKKIIILSVLILPCSLRAQMQFTTWIPDTCPESKIIYQWDDALPIDQRVNTIFKIDKPCTAYKALDDKSQFSAIVAENQMKNSVYNDISATLGTDIKIIVQNYPFSYDINRNLIITAVGANSLSKTTLQNVLNSKYGTGKVTIQ